MEEISLKKKIRRKKILNGILVALAIITIAGVATIILTDIMTKRPIKIFREAVLNSFKKSDSNDVKSEKVSLEVTASCEGTDESIEAMNSYLSLIKLNLNSEVDIEKRIINENLKASVLGSQLLNVDGLIQDDKIYFYLKDIYSKYIEVPTENLEGINVQEIFDKSSVEQGEDIKREIKHILLDEIDKQEFTQETVKLDGKTTRKSTIRLNLKEATAIEMKILNKCNEYLQNEELAKTLLDLQESMQFNETDEVYIDVSIYTRSFLNSVVKFEIAALDVTNDQAYIFEYNIGRKEKNINILRNTRAATTKDAHKILSITLEEKDKNSGTMKIRVNIEDNSFVTLKIKYEIEQNAVINKREILSSIKSDELTEVDYREMYENVKQNEILYSIIEQFNNNFDEYDEKDYNEDMDYNDMEEDVYDYVV